MHIPVFDIIFVVKFTFKQMILLLMVTFFNKHFLNVYYCC